jgi:hypothetical protein
MCIDYEAAGVGSPLVPGPGKPDGWNQTLAKYGQEGWEMVATIDRPGEIVRIVAVCFKRPLQNRGAPQGPHTQTPHLGC